MPVIICRPLEPEGETLPLPMDYYDFYYDEDVLSTPNEGATTTSTSDWESESDCTLPTIIEEAAKSKSKSKSKTKSRSKSRSRPKTKSRSKSKTKTKNEKESNSTKTSSKTKSKTKSKKKSKAKQTKPDPPEALSASTSLRVHSSLIPTKRESHHILSEAEASILNAMDPEERDAFLEEQRQVLEEIEQELASHEMALAMNRELNLDDSGKLSQNDTVLVHGNNTADSTNEKVNNSKSNGNSDDSGKGGGEGDKAQNGNQQNVNHIVARSKLELNEDNNSNTANPTSPSILFDQVNVEQDEDKDRKSLHTDSTKAATFLQKEIVMKQ